ncbi:MAG: hypothetical protein RLZZ581_125 [Actinomycetota bacterium]
MQGAYPNLGVRAKTSGKRGEWRLLMQTFSLRRCGIEKEVIKSGCKAEESSSQESSGQKTGDQEGASQEGASQETGGQEVSCEEGASKESSG